MKLFGIKLLIVLMTISGHAFEHIFDRIPKELDHTDYMFVVEIGTQTNYLFYKKTLIFDVKFSNIGPIFFV